MEYSVIAICVVIVIATFLSWEFVAWLTHKYIMHGPLWKWHRSHHTVHNHTLEKNDLFALFFSPPSIGLLYYFTQVEYNPYWISVGIGVFCYGLFYFIFHDIIVHQRLKWIPEKKSSYLQRMIHAHYIHHSKHTKHGCEAFGFLFAPKKYEPKKFTFRPERSQTQ
jgi:beta-carotene 3-hydroxylase